jgi:hypothetical protein
MTKLAAALLAASLAGGLANADAQTDKKRKSHDARKSGSPSAVAERQRHKSTFDETLYYERLSEKIPFGTPAWWRQKELENTNE